MPPSRHILLVEDEPTLQRILGSVLSDAGHEVEAVSTAEEALDRLGDRDDIDLVLSDKNLPQMNGLDLLDELRRREAESGLLRSFMLVTGYPSRDSALRVLAAGGDGYMVKPFRSLVDAVQEVQGALEADLGRRRRTTILAQQVVAALVRPSQLGQPVAVELLVEDRALRTRVRGHLTAAGAALITGEEHAGGQPAEGLRPVRVASHVEELLALREQNPEAALVLVDAAPSFYDLVALIRAGGSAVVDPVEIGAAP